MFPLILLINCCNTRDEFDSLSFLVTLPVTVDDTRPVLGDLKQINRLQCLMNRYLVRLHEKINFAFSKLFDSTFFNNEDNCSAEVVLTVHNNDEFPGKVIRLKLSCGNRLLKSRLIYTRPFNNNKLIN